MAKSSESNFLGLTIQLRYLVAIVTSYSLCILRQCLWYTSIRTYGDKNPIYLVAVSAFPLLLGFLISRPGDSIDGNKNLFSSCRWLALFPSFYNTQYS